MSAMAAAKMRRGDGGGWGGGQAGCSGRLCSHPAGLSPSPGPFWGAMGSPPYTFGPLGLQNCCPLGAVPCQRLGSAGTRRAGTSPGGSLAPRAGEGERVFCFIFEMTLFAGGGAAARRADMQIPGSWRP